MVQGESEQSIVRSCYFLILFYFVDMSFSIDEAIEERISRRLRNSSDGESYAKSEDQNDFMISLLSMEKVWEKLLDKQKD